VNVKKPLLALTLLACASIAPLRAQAPSLDAHVNLSVADRPIEDVIATLRARSGANIVIINPPTPQGTEPEDVGKRKVTIELTNVEWRDALTLAAESVGLVVETRQAGVLAVTKTPPFNYDIKDGDIVDVIKAIAAVSGANIVLAPEVKGTVSVHFVGVPWREALDVVAKTRGYVVVQGNYGVLRVVDPKTLQDQLETKTYQLRYLRPKSTYKPIIKSEFIQSALQQQQQQQQGGGTKEIAKTFTVLQALTKALSTAGQIEYMDTQNVVIIRDTAQVHEAIRDLLARIDIEPAQVFCDVKFVSTSNGDVLNLGVDYGDGGPQISLSGGQIPVTFPFDPGSGGWEDLIIASPNGHGPYVDPLLNASTDTIVPATIFGALSFTNWQATLRLLQRDTKTEVIQAPKIVALDGSEATIFVGETIRYAEAKSEQGQAGGLQLSVSEADGSPVEIGFQLLIRPNIVPGTNKIVMEVIPKETSLSGTGTSALAPPGFDVFTVGSAGEQGTIALPRTRSSTIVTTMMLETGQTEVIGGLSSDSDTETKSAVPLLSKIPLLGELFKHESKQRERRTLMVFVTPTIVRSSSDAARVLERELDRRKQALKQELDELITRGSEGRPSGASQ
jgi:type II secretory pathway component GspD/PulD (secretin)